MCYTKRIALFSRVILVSFYCADSLNYFSFKFAFGLNYLRGLHFYVAQVLLVCNPDYFFFFGVSTDLSFFIFQVSVLLTLTNHSACLGHAIGKSHVAATDKTRSESLLSAFPLHYLNHYA